jgi:hypothetical protein
MPMANITVSEAEGQGERAPSRAMGGQLIFGLGIGFAPEWALYCTSPAAVHGGP